MTGCPLPVEPPAADAARELLGRLALQAARDSRTPWELIWNEVPAKQFATGEPAGMCPDVDSLRVVDAENRLLLRIDADPEQILRAEDMAFIAAASPDVVLGLLAERTALREALAALIAAADHRANLDDRDLIAMAPKNVRKSARQVVVEFVDAIVVARAALAAGATQEPSR